MVGMGMGMGWALLEGCLGGRGMLRCTAGATAPGWTLRRAVVVEELSTFVHGQIGMDPGVSHGILRGLRGCICCKRVACCVGAWAGCRAGEQRRARW